MAIARLVWLARLVRPAGLVPVVVALLVAAALTSCGGGATLAKTTTAPHGKHYVAPYADIYAGLPLSGPMAREGHAILLGIHLALGNTHTESPDLQIEFHLLNDSGRKTLDDDLALTAANAGTVAIDPRAVYYIGDFGSAATAVSLPVLSAAGIAQVTPGDPYIEPQSGSAAPPSTLLRLLPGYTVQAAADVEFFKQIPNAPACTRILAVAQDDPEAMALVNAMYTDAKADGIEMPKPTSLTSKATSLTTYENALQQVSPAPCGVVIAGRDTKLAVTLTKIVHSRFPTALIVGTSGLCAPNSRWTKAAVHGSQAVTGSLLWCTSPLLPLDQYLGGAHFVKLYESAHGGSYPSPYAFYGYEAAYLGIQMVDYLAEDGDNRELVRENLFESEVRDSQFSPYGYLLNGDSTLSTYGVYNVNPATGEPHFDATLRPPVP
jgi:branched-chain amino acid transport system substrate-binding protein